MSDPSDDDMDKPLTKREALDLFVTKREFREVLGEAFANLLMLLDKRFDAIDKRFDAIDKRFDEEFSASESRMKNWFSTELARHTGAVDERHRTELSVVDDKYKDLPERVTKLEAAVFPAPPAKRQRRR